MPDLDFVSLTFTRSGADVEVRSTAESASLDSPLHQGLLLPMLHAVALNLQLVLSWLLKEARAFLHNDLGLEHVKILAKVNI